MGIKFSNNAVAVLDGAINDSVTSMDVVDASLFPTLGGSDYCYLTLLSVAGDEIVKVTAIAGNTLTMVRAQEGTTARSYADGARIELRITAALLVDALAEVLTATAADLVLTNADAASTAADAISTAADAIATAADAIATAADASSTSADRVLAETAKTAAELAQAAAEAASAGVFWKEPARVSSSANLTLSGEQTIDGVAAVTGDRVLVKDQTAPAENGVYIVAAGAWSRAVPMDTWDEHVGAVVLVTEGSLGENKAYQCVANAGGTLDTTDIVWSAFGAVAINVVVDTFVDVTDYTSGTTTALTLSASAGSADNILVTFDGVTQHHDQFTLSDVTLTFNEAIPLGTAGVEVRVGSALGIGTPSDGTVTEAKIATSAVTEAKIADGSVTAAKLASGAVSVVNPNLIINGDMRIAQRGTVASIGSPSYGGPDRFQINLNGTSNYTLEQNSDAPANTQFQNSLRLTTGTGDALGAAADFVLIRTMFEGQDLAQFKKGTTNAESMTLTFWARSSVTGTHIVRFRDHDNIRAISGSYSIAVADTWEFQTITVAGDTTGAFGDDNGRSFALEFFVGAGTDYTSGTLSTAWAAQANANGAVGQVNGVATTSNIFGLTGVKLEVGSTATDFVPDDYGTAYAKCQRYYWRSAIITNGLVVNETQGTAHNASLARPEIVLGAAMRTKPTFGLSPAYSSGWAIHQASGNFATTNGGGVIGSTPNNGSKYIIQIGMTGGVAYRQSYLLNSTGGDGYYELDAEL